MGSSSKNRWKFSFNHHRSSSTSSSISTASSASTTASTTTPTDPNPKKKKTPPPEFLCPISSLLMSDPVILPSGHTFERNIIQACIDLRLFPKSLLLVPPILSSSPSPSPPLLIPNLALRSTIFSWCDAAGLPRPEPPNPFAAIDLVRSLHSDPPPPQDDDYLLLHGVADKPNSHRLSHATTDVSRRPPKHFYSSCSDEESFSAAAATPPLPLATKPSCYSSLSSSPSSVSPSSSSSEITPPQPPASKEEEEIVRKLKSVVIFEQEEAVALLRNISRSSPEQRIPLCTPRLLASIRPLLVSRYPQVQINATAAVVNLSLEKTNKERIVRSGAVPPLIDVLKGGFPEAQEHAAGAIFSLALEDDNKPAIGVLGALQPLLHLLRHESHRARQDAAMALYHLSLLQCNRTKLVKLGAVPLLLGYSKGGELAGRAMLILCNLALVVDGRAALMDADAVQVFVEMLRDDSVGEAMREHCVSVLYALSTGGSVLRFKGMAKAAGAVEVLKEVVDRGKSEKAREKAKRMLIILRGKGDVTAVAGAVGGIEGVSWEDEGDWIQEDDGASGTNLQLRQRLPSKEKNENGANSTHF